LISPIFPEIPRCSGKAENEEYAEFDISVNTKKQNLNYAVYREEREIYSSYSSYSAYSSYR